MIISASYKTDIPTFYGDWFISRLRAGYCKTVNPFNQKVSRVSLAPEYVDGFVFWTKNIGPFLQRLAEVDRLGFPFIVQHTINGYPRVLEHSVVDAARSVDNVRRIAGQHGPRVCVWRYDTIVESSVTPRGFHLSTFERLAKGLSGATDEVVISFAHLYQKTLRNMDRAAQENDFVWTDPSAEWKRQLVTELVDIAAVHGIRVSLCSQPQYLVPGSGEARCVDADRLQDIAGKSIRASLRGNRKECGCFESRDIGEYDTCPHGCVYCYAVRERSLATRRFKEHNPHSEFLFPPTAAEVNQRAEIQLPLFRQRHD